ncbi:hypothetical protein HDV00_001915 [Rhizophlyctis rosea]|nr:hypothetical protein HDV00_001915 [Rhizophlyctis rosea]
MPPWNFRHPVTREELDEKCGSDVKARAKYALKLLEKGYPLLIGTEDLTRPWVQENAEGSYMQTTLMKRGNRRTVITTGYGVYWPQGEHR